MSYATKFNGKIQNIIDRFAYEMYFIKRNTDIKCTCITHETDQANVDCPKCLGTGFKVTIRKIKAAAQETKLPPTLRNDKFLVARAFFVAADIKTEKGDLIIDKDTPYMILDKQELISFEGTNPITKVDGVKKKFDSKVLIKNFNAIINSKK